MDFKTFCKRAFLIYECIRDKETSLEEIRSRATYCTTVWDEAPSKAQASRIEVFGTQACELDRQIVELKSSAKEIENILEQLNDPKHKTLLECRYIYNDYWSSIAFKLHLTSDHVRGRMHQQAISELEKILELTS